MCAAQRISVIYLRRGVRRGGQWDGSGSLYTIHFAQDGKIICCQKNKQKPSADKHTAIFMKNTPESSSDYSNGNEPENIEKN